MSSRRVSTEKLIVGSQGHRQRLRERFLAVGGEAFADYELLELVLFGANPRGDTKPLAKKLIARFGGFAEVIAASPDLLKEIEGVGDVLVVTLKAIETAAIRLAREKIQNQPVIGSWSAVLDYCRAALAHRDIEQFRILFLDKQNTLIADEMQQTGTIDHTPVYPREVVKRALALNASSLILVHNHPSGDPSPSKADIEMTLAIQRAAAPMNINIHDHLIIGLKGHISFKSIGLL